MLIPHLKALICHTDLEARPVGKKVQAMRLCLSSNLPICAVKIIEKQIFSLWRVVKLTD